MRHLFDYKIRQKFIATCFRFLLQNVAVLLRIATVITKCVVFTKYVGTQDTDIETYSIHTEEKSVFLVKSIRTWKDKDYKYMTAMPKKVCIDNLDAVVYKYNMTLQRYPNPQSLSS